MIISHKYKYLFVELPHTASTAVSQELRDNYDGHQILWKHSPYHQFLRIANTEEKSYFVFSCIRNPLDVVITEYFRIKTNHEGAYTDPKRWRRNGGWVPDYQLRQFNFIQDNNADFATFFKRFHKVPYDNWSCLAHKQFDFVIRFENLQSDFAKVLKLLGIEQKRALPLKNKTGNKQHFLSYYTPEIQGQAKRVFGPFMEKWDYDFPSEWGDNSVSWLGQVEFHLRSVPRKLYWRYLKSWEHLRKRSVEH
jgi:hypothetical protein